ncbi:hypothetical protein [Paracoccus sp. 22332]|uniref:hypothetical protein n=1 Tax=Paracoccus sp. 22332 TaxID=3453913 RepID=UPI003F84ABCB
MNRSNIPDTARECMTLTAPNHLRGKMTNARLELKQARDEWIREHHQLGYRAKEIADALCLRAEIVQARLRLLGCGRKIVHSVGSLQHNSIVVGNAYKAIGAMSPCARAALADAAARKGKPMVQAMADFWAQHHGAQG